MAALRAILSLSFLIAVASAVRILNDVYIIRNAEEAPLGAYGFSNSGKTRSSCLPNLFASGPMTPGYIIACTRAALDVSAICHSASATASPIASRLSLPLDTDCPVDDDEAYFAVEPDNDNVEDPSDCLSRKLETFAATNSNPILIVWDQNYMEDILDSMDVDEDVPDFPMTQPATIWRITNGTFVGATSQGCSGLDANANYPTQTFFPRSFEEETESIVEGVYKRSSRGNGLGMKKRSLNKRKSRRQEEKEKRKLARSHRRSMVVRSISS